MFPRSPWQSKNPVFCEVLKILKRSEVQFMRQSLASLGSIHAEMGPLVLGRVLESASLAERLSSGNGLVGFILPQGEWLASFLSRIKGRTSSSTQAQSHSPSQPRGHCFWRLAQRGLVSWSSGAANRLMAVFGSRIGFFLLWQAVLFLPLSFTHSQSHMVMDNNSGFACCCLWRQLRNPSSVIPADNQSMYGRRRN